MSVAPLRPEMLGRIMNDRPAWNPAARCGRFYILGEVNHCPGCGRMHWDIRLTTAECAFCLTALPLDQPGAVTKPTIWRR